MDDRRVVGRDVDLMMNTLVGSLGPWTKRGVELELQSFLEQDQI